MFADLFVLLYIGHLAADYPLQTDHQAAHKACPGVKGWRANAVHALTHVVACAVAVGVGVLFLNLTVSPAAATAGVLWIGATHAFIDRRWPVRWWMRVARQESWAAHGGAAHVDQTAHILALAVAALALS